MEQKLIYKTPEMEALPISLKETVCLTVSDFQGFGNEQNWDGEV